jgi:perosamine synthetase
MRIPFAEPNIGDREKEYVSQALDSGWVGGKGEFIDRFEAKFAKYIGVDHAITCSNGTMALLLAYHACGMGSQHRVVMPDTTFISTLNMATILTKNIELRTVEKDTWTLNLNDIKDAFGVAVHLYGNPCDMGQVYRKKFPLIEDCAESLGSKYRGKMVGSYGLASIFSFHSAKTITTGEGGMVCTNNDEVARRVRHLKNQSMSEPYKFTGMGYNARMTNVQAAMGLAQLERVDELNDIKRQQTRFYNDNLGKNFIRQKVQRNSDPVMWANAYRNDRAPEIRQKLAQAGIETRPGFLGDDVIVFPCSTKLSQGDLDFIVGEANQHA